MILDLQLQTSSLAGNNHATDNFALCPDLAILSDNDSVWLDPREIYAPTLNHIDFPRMGNQSPFALPNYGDDSTKLILYSSEVSAESDG